MPPVFPVNIIAGFFITQMPQAGNMANVFPFMKEFFPQAGRRTRGIRTAFHSGRHLWKFYRSVFLAVWIFLFCSPARAVEYEIRGQWIMSFGYGMNGKFVQGKNIYGFLPGQDNFNPREKVSLQLEAAVSDMLSGSVYFDIGDIIWGQGDSGGALGADAPIVKVGNAFIDWTIPAIATKVRMGIQSLKTPALASGNSIFNGSAAGIVASLALSDCFSITGAWARAYNDNYSGPKGLDGFRDNADVFGLLFPVQLEGIRVIPWGGVALIEPNTSRLENARYPFGNFSLMGGDAGNFREGMFPVGGARHRNFADANGERTVTSRACGLWGGLTGEFDVLPHLRLSFDVEYGFSKWNSDGRLERRGWLATFNIDSANNWGTPGVYAWYGSGDDANPANGSERLPAFDPGNSINYSPLAYDGSSYIERNALIGNNLAGTFGIGIKAANLHIFEKMSQTLRANYIRGTNSSAMARKMSLAGLWANGMELAGATVGGGAALGMPNLYLAEGDCALELSAITHYRQNDHFSVFLNAGWIGLSLDGSEDGWGARHARGESIPSTANAWNANMTLVFYF